MRLRHWTHPRKEIEFDPEKGKGKLIKLQAERDKNAACPGFSFKESSYPFKSVQFAVYKQGSNIIFAAGVKKWALNSANVQLIHKHIGKCFSSLSVSVNGNVEFTFKYFHPFASLSAFIDGTYDNIDYDGDFPLAFIAENSTDEEWAKHVLDNWSQQ